MESQGNGSSLVWCWEVLPHEAYLVKVHGSRALTTRNRRLLRKVVPFKPALPVSTMETQVVISQPTGYVSKDSQDVPAQDVPVQDVLAQDVPAQDVPAQDVQAPPAPLQVCQPVPVPTAATHRHQPVVALGSNIVELLQRREDLGFHLSLEMDHRAHYM